MMAHRAQTIAPLLEGLGLGLDAPGGRPLFRDLNVQLERGRVAVIGRNGAGKSTLLRALAGQHEPTAGRIIGRGSVGLIAQTLDPRAVADALARHQSCRRTMQSIRRELEALGIVVDPLAIELDRLSAGELRKVALAVTRIEAPEVLLLDEPARDLDARGVQWLVRWLAAREDASVVVSHDRALLAEFESFFICAESGCRLFEGSLRELEADFEARGETEQKRYVRNLNRLADAERRSARTASRRRRKKNLGRLHELRRAPSRAKLGENRSYAQESQGRRGVLLRQRIEARRAWTVATRRALNVKLELELEAPTLACSDGEPCIELAGVGFSRGERELFRGIDLRLARERVAVVGPNGSGKTTLLQIACGALPPGAGESRVRTERLGVIAQGASNWNGPLSLLELLAPATRGGALSAVAEDLARARFPFALAERPMSSLSPGERVRAALICLYRSSVECLVLDEPTASLDFVGSGSLERILAAWPGGLLVTSHDHRFLDTVGIERVVELGGVRREV